VEALNAPSSATAGGLGSWRVDFGDVALDILPDVPGLTPAERTGDMQPTDGAGIDHVAFSYTDLEGALARVEAAGFEIERAMETEEQTGLQHFFLRAPNGVLVELVEAQPLPDAAWR
jgi:catechol 2,3-dioxygenase-like lactoylglutathione lyase family enzyme